MRAHLLVVCLLGLGLRVMATQTPFAHVVTVLAGASSQFGYVDGAALAARFNQPSAVAVHESSGVVFVGDKNWVLRRIPREGLVTTFAGSTNGLQDGIGTAAKFQALSSLAIHQSQGLLFSADHTGHVIRSISLADASVQTVAGHPGWGSTDGVGTAATFINPTGLAMRQSTGILYVSDVGGARIRALNTATRVVTSVAGGGAGDGVGILAGISNVLHMSVRESTGMLYFVDSGLSTIRQLELATNRVTTIAGTGTAAGNTVGSTPGADGVGTAAQFSYPLGIAVRDTTGTIFIVDPTVSNFRMMDIATAAVTTFAGPPGSYPGALALDEVHDRVVGIDRGAHTVLTFAIAPFTPATVPSAAVVVASPTLAWGRAVALLVLLFVVGVATMLLCWRCVIPG
jgi:hypothetical protein